MMFLAICSVQNVQNDRTDIFGLKISRNMPYGIDSYLPIMIFARFFRRKTCFFFGKLGQVVVRDFKKF